MGWHHHRSESLSVWSFAAPPCKAWPGWAAGIFCSGIQASAECLATRGRYVGMPVYWWERKRKLLLPEVTLWCTPITAAVFLSGGGRSGAHATKLHLQGPRLQQGSALSGMTAHALQHNLACAAGMRGGVAYETLSCVGC